MTASDLRHSEPVGETLRRRRVEVLGKGLRETAKLLGVTPAHLTDLEKGRRTPSEQLLVKVARVYGVDEAILRAGWGKADADVGRIASQSPTTAAKAPALLRAASDLDDAQWDALIAEAKRLADRAKKQATKKAKRKRG